MVQLHAAQGLEAGHVELLIIDDVDGSSNILCQQLSLRLTVTGFYLAALAGGSTEFRKVGATTNKSFLSKTCVLGWQ